MLGLRPGNPVLEQMIEIIKSQEGKKAAEDAAAAGKPAMARVDPLLRQKLGPQYSKDNQGPQRAGWEVARLMRCLGYEEKGVKEWAEGSIRGRGKLWVKPST